MQLTKSLIDKISILTELCNIAVVDDNLFVYYTFEPSVSSNTMSVDFNSLTAICITEFITMTPIDPSTQPKELISKLIRYLDNKPQLNIKFSKNSSFFLFAR